MGSLVILSECSTRASFLYIDHPLPGIILCKGTFKVFFGRVNVKLVLFKRSFAQVLMNVHMRMSIPKLGTPETIRMNDKLYMESFFSKRKKIEIK